MGASRSEAARPAVVGPAGLSSQVPLSALPPLHTAHCPAFLQYPCHSSCPELRCVIKPSMYSCVYSRLLMRWRRGIGGCCSVDTSPAQHELGSRVYTSNPIIHGAKAEGSGVQERPQLQSEWDASTDDVRPCQAGSEVWWH